MSSAQIPTDQPLSPDALATGLAEVYRALGPLYRKVSRTVEHLQPEMGMSVGARAVLECLREADGRTVPQIARTLQLSRQFVQRMVNDGRRARWIEARENPAHQTSPLMHLTQAGQSAIQSVVDYEHQLMGQVPGELRQTELEATLKVLRAMSAGLDEVSVGRAPLASSAMSKR